MSISRLNSLLACACLPLLLISLGCRKEGAAAPTGTSEKGNSTLPSIDARGGESNSELSPAGQHTVLEGSGGAGGSIRFTSSAGNVQISNAAVAASPQDPDLTGAGLTVNGDEEVKLSGAFVVDFLHVIGGGVLTLTGNTFFVVLGDVHIAGTVRSARSTSSIDAHDLTIDADGIVNITGTIDMSGFDGEDHFEIDQERGAGGHGGEIFIESLETTAVSPGPHIFISGSVKANGGDTFATRAEKARPGHGGQILIGSQGVVVINGRVNARGGFSQNQGTLASATATGGEIQILAVDNLQVGRVREINASGGTSTGSAAGDGGSILCEAPLGTVDLADFDIECRGGKATFASGASAGDGGAVTFTGESIALDNVAVNASGGDAPGDQRRDGSAVGGITGGIGGDGGSVQMAAMTAIVVDDSVALLAEGGRSNFSASAGGAGGAIKVVSLDEADPTIVVFDGGVSVIGGLNELGSAGADGTVCERGADDLSAIFLTGTSNFPIAVCSSEDLDFVVHELDCDDTTINPDTVTTEFPAVLGIDFYRVDVGAATAVTITTAGESGGNLSLYAGTDAVFGSTDPADYAFSSALPDSAESITIDLTAFDPGAFVSILVDERDNFVETYTLSVSCSGP